MASSPFEHAFLSGLLGDDEIAAHLSPEADIAAMCLFEAALARAQARLGIISTEAADRIVSQCDSFVPDMARLKSAVAIDSVVVPELVKQLRQRLDGEASERIHFGSTSQDAIDTSLMLRLKTITSIFASRVEAILDLLDALDQRFGSRSLTGYTRMQRAIPIRVSDRLHSWRDPLDRQLGLLRRLEFPVQFGGAAGSLEKLGEQGASVRGALAKELGLSDWRQWHSQRDPVVAIADTLSALSGLLGKIGQDIAIMAQMGDEISMEGGGSSSAMAHKQNPVAAETLVTLARFNAVQISGLHHSLVHEQERSGAAWMLEWLVLPQMIMATATSLRLGKQMLAQIKSIGS